MVKLTGPLHSTRASGKLGKAIQFGNWNNRWYAGIRRRPKQPRTRPQLAARIFMGGIAKLWNGLTPAQQASWQQHPAAAATSAYHAYLQENSNRYQKMPNRRWNIDDAHCAPSAVWPATEDTRSAYFVNIVLTGRSKSVLLQFDMNIPQDNWLGTIHYAEDATDYMRYNNLAGMLLVENIASYEILIEDLPPGNHALRILPVDHTGGVYYDGYYRTVTILP
ncbi:hypothetical protein LCGC14_1554900 [marine sediment metagenome]|uniref:Uncharacterized protein n=1 Tax=marine sediment metagenome TaxID=412755 RepID=A0A0F9JA76_9ZZZZ